MSASTSIEWTDKTWNPVRGCRLVSPGCAHCYAMSFAHRFSGSGKPYEGLTKLRKKGGPVWTGDFREAPDMLGEPLSWRKPARVFVNSMSDLFGEGVSNEYIAAVFGVMAASTQHTFQVLTKRADRLPQWFEWVKREAARGLVTSLGPVAFVASLASDYVGEGMCTCLFERQGNVWPLPNVHIGVSVEDRPHGVPRIEHVRSAPAAVRFLSIEPLLEDLGALNLDGIGWVIVGGESGPGARPMHPDWVRSLRDQCAAASVPFFFKQWGEWAPEIDRDRDDPDWRRDYTCDDRSRRILNLAGGHGFHGDRVHLMAKVGKKKAGRELDGRTWDELPKVGGAS